MNIAIFLASICATSAYAQSTTAAEAEVSTNSNSLPQMPWSIPVPLPNGYSIWGRTFDTGPGLLPRQITSKQRQILAAPITISLKLVGQQATELLFERGSETIAGTVLARSGMHQSKSYTAHLQTEIDYDGFIKFNLQISANDSSLRIEKLAVNLAIKKEIAQMYSKFLDYDFDKQRTMSNTVSSGPIDENLQWHFNPTIWLGNSDIGIEWVHESNINFSLRSPEKTQTINLTDNAVILTTNIIDHATKLKHPLNYSFALLATPSKPENKKWRDFQITSGIPTKAQIKKGQCCDQLIYIGHWRRTPLDLPGIPLPSKEPALNAKYVKHRNILSDSGAKYLPYSSLYMLPSTIPEVSKNPEWHSAPARKGSVFWMEKIKSKRPIQPVYYKSKSIQDYVIDTHLQAINNHQIDGIYIDVATMRELSTATSNLLKTNQKKQNKHSVYYPVFSHREFVKRYWEATKAVNPNFVIIHHSAYLPKFSNTFIDIAVFGEPLHHRFNQGKIKNRINKTVDGPKIVNKEPENYTPNYFLLDKYTLPGPRFTKEGTTYALLPQIKRFNTDYLDKNESLHSLWTRTAIAAAFLNDFILWNTRAHNKTLRSFQSILDKHGSLEHSEFFQINHETTDHKIAGYISDNKLLVMIANPTDTVIKLTSPIESLLPTFDKWRVTNIQNAENNVQVPLATKHFAIPPSDFILLTIETTRL